MRGTLLVALALAVASACGGLTLHNNETADQSDASTSGSSSGGRSTDGSAGDELVSDSTSGSGDSSLDAGIAEAETPDVGQFDAAEAGTPDSGPLFFGPQCPDMQPTNGGTCQIVGCVRRPIVITQNAAS